MPVRILSLALLAVFAFMSVPDAADGAPSVAGLAEASSSAGRAPAEPDAVGAAAPLEADPGYWIVVLEGEPLASYAGGVRNLTPTSPKATGGAYLDTDSPDSAAYLEHLDAIQYDALESVEGVIGKSADVLFRYRYATNGFAVRLTPDEAVRVAKLPGVLAVEPNTLQYVNTDAGPTWIGAPAMWDGSAVGSEVGTMGEGIVVGVIDTGINMDHPSFAAVDEQGYQHTNPKGEFLGFCNPSHPNYDSRLQCNEKLIGVYSFLTGAVNPLDPEDDHDHGSHTASTAAGNFLTLLRQTPTAKIEQRFSGVAPHANIIAYDACYYEAGGEGACPPVATLKALDQSVADGVDVMNYSISTSQGSPWLDSHMLAFKRMRDAGIVAAVSAGNDGPGASTTRAVAPWVMAVAATRHGRFFANSVAGVGGGDTPPPGEMQGGGMTGSLGPESIVWAGRGDFVNVDGDADAGRCLRRFPPGTFNGEIVVCDAGGSTGRVQRGSNIQAGGAGGLILANEQSQGEKIVSDNHLIPAVHIGYEDATRLRAWLAGGEGHTAEIAGAHSAPRNELGGALGSFSSRGPAESTVCCLRPGLESSVLQPFDVIKPDLSAPGVDIIAAYASRSGRTPPEFGSMSGTSMASPHVAGAAALLKAAQPDWSAAEIQSALMLTAVGGDVRMQDNRTAAGWFDKGSGRTDVSRAARSGLLMDVTDEELDAANPNEGGHVRDINLPSLADSHCLSGCSWTRRVRNPLDRPVTWTAFNETPDKLSISVRPARFVLEPGASAEIEIKARVEDMPIGAWVQGDILLQPDADDVPDAHIPVAVRPVRAVAPPMIVAMSDSSNGTLDVKGLRATGVDELRIDVHGLELGLETNVRLDEDPTPTSPFDNPGGKGSHVITLNVEQGAERVLAEIAASQAPDIDLYVGRDANGDGVPQEREMVCVSGSPSWEEFCGIEGSQIRPGVYWVLVQNFGASDRPPDAVTIVTSVVSSGDAENLTVSAPDSVEDGVPFDLTLDWDLPGLGAGDRWFGVIELGSSADSGADLGRITVDVLGVARPVYLPFADKPMPSSGVIPTGGDDWAPSGVIPTGGVDWAPSEGVIPTGGDVWAPPEADLAYHIVLLEGEPLAGYHGGAGQLEATSPAATGDARLDTDSPASAAYLEYLDSVQDAAVAAIEDVTGQPADVLFRYRYATNGLAVRLSPEEAKRVAELPGVLAVEPNTPQLLDTDAGPAWIGAPAVWDGSALGSDVGAYGEGVVVGVIDTGINMDHPSFAAVDERGYEHLNPRGKFLGFCDPEHTRYNSSLICNDKLIGVHSFLTSGQRSRDPEDDHGHGSHTASTAAGNFVTTEYRAPTTSVTRTFSGVAPHANIVAYDACHDSNGQGVCPPTATLAALDQAVVDRVDVVNYSIATGNASPWLNAHALAFKRIREAGIVAAVSAGNSGPGAGTTGAIYPWVMTVGATTHNRYFGNTLDDMSGGDGPAPDDIRGRSLTAGYGPAPIVYAGSGEYDSTGGGPDNGSCLLPFPSRTFDGEIVVCDRGEIPRLDKGRNVFAGGAGGLVLANKQENGVSINGDGHTLAAVHVTYEDGQRLKAWLADGTGHSATISEAESVLDSEAADVMASFSARGPASSAFCCRRPGLDIAVPQLFSVLKPDIVAPGMDIIAAFNTDGEQPEPEMKSAQGTSMSSPHAAGAAALLRSAHPDWTPAEIQSALMTTAESHHLRKEDAESPAAWFDQGAGRIDVGRAAAAGLVLDIPPADMNAANPAAGGDPRKLNLASLTDTRCLDRCTWTRTVRNPLDRQMSWSVAEPRGGAMPVTASPERFTIEPGGTRTITFEADARALPRHRWAFSDVVLAADDPAVPSARFPAAVYPVPAIIPELAMAQADAAEGSLTIGDLRAGDAEQLQISVHGLVRADLTEIELKEDPTPNSRYDRPDGVHWLTFDVPEGARRLAVEVTSSEASDVDLFLGFDANGDGQPQAREQRCTSLSGGWAEYCELTGDRLAESGTYWAMVQNYNGSRSGRDAIGLATAVVLEGDLGNLSAAGPADVVMGERFDLDLTWDLPDLVAGDRWLGVVELGSSPEHPADIGAIMVDIVGVETAPTVTPRPPTDTPRPPTATPEPPTETPEPPTATPTDDPAGTPSQAHLPWAGKRAK